jgi:hypothetical protein
MKRGVSIETFREKNDAPTFHANKHFAPYLYDSSKVVKLGAATLTTLEVKQDASISGGKASFTVTGYPTNVSYGWKAYAATNLDAAVSVTVGTDFENGSGEDHAAFAAEYVAGFKYNATNGKYFQVIYVDAAGKIRGTGNVAPNDVTDVPARYEPTQVMACVAGFSLQGLENQTASTENAITRQFKYSNMLEFIRASVVPYAQVM